LSEPRPKPEPIPERTHCECGGPFRFDPLIEGETCGGLHRIGWLICDACGETSVTKRGVTAGGFKLAGGGRSLDADGFRVRAEGDGDPSRLMARLARLPDLEAALRQVAHRAGGDAAIRALALAALGGEP